MNIDRLRQMAGWVCAACTALLPVPVAATGAQPALSGDESVLTRFSPLQGPLANPERGLAGWAFDLARPWAQGIAAEARAGYRLQRSHIQLDDFRTRDLSPAFLARLEQGFAIVREAGVKVIPRFSYNSPAADFLLRLGAADAALPQVLRHIEQLGPVMRANADVIAYLEAGFIGAWGEWHSSGSGLDSPTAKAQVRDALLAHFPGDRFILFRDPADLRRWYPDPAAAAAARMGMHNDCFLSGDTDADTYPDPTLRDYAAGLARQAPFGGETCAHTPLRTRCDQVLAEGARYRLTWLNRYGAMAKFEPAWRAQGCHARVLASIGYRFELVSLTHPSQVDPASGVSMRLGLRNTGWSRLHNRRALVVGFSEVDTGERIEHRLEALDATQWLPGPPASLIEQTLVVPAPPAGRWRISLGLPDPAPSLAADVRYAIRFANADQVPDGARWDAALGRFDTGAVVSVRAPR
ncbi:MAG: DUF4832 domain-containing protein [Burkholderiaceae bacterium]